MADDIDLAIRIPADLILKEFECPVCFGTIHESVVTSCGHTFCKACIEECLNRRHECPNCKHETTIDQVVRNFTNDAIISNLHTEILLHEKEKATTDYFNNITGVLKRSDSYSLNPIESVFCKNMKTSFLEFERYFDDLRQRTERLKSRLLAQDPNRIECASRLQELDENLGRSIDMLVESLDKHMKSVAPSPDLLPVRVFLKVPRKNLTLDLHIPRTHTATDLQQTIIDYYLSRGDQVNCVTEGRFILHQALRDEAEIIELDHGPIGRFGVIQGSTIFFDGDISLKSEAPKVCFTKNFEKGKGLKTNYYHCFSCNSNWICEPCAQSCHSNHNISVAVPNHEPTWACCYCVKKGLCRIPNNKNN